MARTTITPWVAAASTQTPWQIEAAIILGFFLAALVALKGMGVW